MRKCIVAGGRKFVGRKLMRRALSRLMSPEDIIVSGGAGGADLMGEQYGRHFDHQIIVMPAEWQVHGKKAGILRNREMAEAADVLFAFWDGSSKGTKNMIDTALSLGLEVHVYRY